MQRTELWLLVIVTAGVLGAVFLGQQGTATGVLRDQRRSIVLEGPEGGKGLADALRKIGVQVEARRRPFFDWASDSFATNSSVLALLEVAVSPTGAELREMRNAVARGASVFTAGINGLEECFAYRVRYFDELFGDSTVAVVSTGGLLNLPSAAAVIERIPTDSLITDDEPDGGFCQVLFPLTVDTLVQTRDGDAVAVRLRFRSGGDVTMVADPSWVSNVSLREHDTGLLVIPWLLESRPAVVVFDEYHQGFQERRSIFGAAFRWMRHSPAGWMMLQLSVAGIFAIALMAVRFGPALSVVERKRRSPMEHLDALAVGLERARGERTAANLIVSGLRRRLRRGGGEGKRQRYDIGDRLGALALAMHTSEARARVNRLGRLVNQAGGDEQVLNIATAVEDVWETVGRENWRSKS